MRVTAGDGQENKHVFVEGVKSMKAIRGVDVCTVPDCESMIASESEFVSDPLAILL
jgi:hypothetical protein